jgi:hypothetical protein
MSKKLLTDGFLSDKLFRTLNVQSTKALKSITKGRQ